jgi:hypothetical protein
MRKVKVEVVNGKYEASVDGVVVSRRGSIKLMRLSGSPQIQIFALLGRQLSSLKLSMQIRLSTTKSITILHGQYLLFEQSKVRPMYQQ